MTYHSTPLEDYALLSDMHTGPLVSRNGSIDWLCQPRFDSEAIFMALLGTPDDGRWRLSVANGDVTERRYRGDTFILETYWTSPTGTARVTDFMPPNSGKSEIVRQVECLAGSITVEHDLRLRFSYARVQPFFRSVPVPDSDDLGLLCTAGPDGVFIVGPALETTVDPTPDDIAELVDNAESGVVLAPRLRGTIELAAGESAAWTMTWFRPWKPVPEPLDVTQALADTEEFWHNWIRHLDTDIPAPIRPLVVRSLLVLRGLTHKDTGGIVAAPTTSLPEDFGGERNWDYRYTWLRDAALTVEVMVRHGLTDGALAWRDWLLRAVAGDPGKLQIMYGLSGERELPERELLHLRGYENSRPVRVGNGAAGQYQADVVGEVMLALARLRDAGIEETPYTWSLQVALLQFAEDNFDRRDHGIWEMRGERHYFTHGRVMMWAAFNEGIRAVEQYGLDGDVEKWRELRDRLHAEIHERGYNEEIGAFTQTYGSTEVDASLLQLPHTGFIAADDPKMVSTVRRIEQDLVDGVYVYRYRTEAGVDGLRGNEYPFLICSFWLIEQYAGMGDVERAEKALWDLVMTTVSDLGLLAEEYDPEERRLAGNFPQAFSHLGLIRAWDAIAAQRKERE